MNKTELASQLAQRTGLRASQASEVVNALFDPKKGILSGALRKGDSVGITGFGSFSVRQRAARTGRNPRTGKEIKIKASKTCAFRPGKGLKDAVA